LDLLLTVKKNLLDYNQLRICIK